MKRNGRANKPRQLAGRSDPARSHAHPDSRAEGLRQRYGLAEPQPHLRLVSRARHMRFERRMETGGPHAYFEAQGTRRSGVSWGSAKPPDARAPEIPVCGPAKRGTGYASPQLASALLTTFLRFAGVGMSPDDGDTTQGV